MKRLVITVRRFFDWFANGRRAEKMEQTRRALADGELQQAIMLHANLTFYCIVL